MQHTNTAKTLPRADGASGRRCRLILCVAFALGLALVFGGLTGMRRMDASGFSDECAFPAIYRAHAALIRQYENDTLPALRTLEAANPSGARAVRDAIDAALASLWGEANAAQLESYVEARPDGDAARAQLLAIAYAVDGPKVSSSVKKGMAALTAEQRAAFRQELLAAIADPAAAPELALAALEKAKEGEASATLMQLFFTCANADNEPLPSEITNDIKKGARAAEARLSAYQMAVAGDVTYIGQLLTHYSRTWILLGVLLALDMLLLALLLWRDNHWHIDFKWLVMLAIIDFMLVFQVLPLVYLVVRAFFPDGSFSLEVFKRLYTYSMNLDALKNTLIAAFSAMVLGTLIAFPLAWLVGRTNLYCKKFFRSLFVLTYMVPPYVGAMAWLRLLNPNVGNINQILRALMGSAETAGPLNIYTLGGLIWVLTTFYYPYAFITISRAMEKMDPSLEEASRVAGASPLKTLGKITLPMMTPSLIAGALLVFVCAASCYGIPSIIGAPGKVHTVTTRIIEYNGLGAQGINDATGLAVFLMVMAIIILYISDFVVARKQYITVSGKSTRPNIVDLGRARVPLTVGVWVFAGIVILLPFATILTTSFKTDVGKTLFDAGNFTLTQWTTIFSRTETLDCLRNSLVYGVVTASVGVVVSCVMSYLLQRTQVRGRKIPDFLITLGSGTPSVVIALGLIMTMKGEFGVNIYNTAYIMIIAYLVKYLMMGMRTVVSAMSQIHVSLEECSQVCGASWFKTMLRITGPLIFPSIAAGWFLIFIPSFYELSMTTLLYSNTTKTIGFQLYEYWTFTSQPQSCAMAFGILAIVVGLNFIMNKLTKGEFSI